MGTNFEAARARFTEGVQAFESSRLPEAEALFLDALRLLPGRASTLANLAAVRMRLGRPAEALAALDSALAAAPDDARSWYDRGLALQTLERPAEALPCFERVLALEPGQAAAWSQRGGILKDLGRLDEAAHCFRQALAHGGDAELNRYFLASVSSATGAVDDVPTNAPRAYVEGLFDTYAEDFDAHLVGKLGYRTPEMLAALLPRGRVFDAALDLGCGTGLMAPQLAPRCAALDGVDLSSQMLARAAALGLYRKLVHGDVAEHLHASAERYEAVVAADVFVYVGALERVFDGVVRVLQPGGLFAFSVEESDAGDVQLRASSRYAHSEAYVQRLAATRGFAPLAQERGTLRHDQRRAIGGIVFLFGHE